MSSSPADSPETVALQESLWRGLRGMGTPRQAVAGTVLFREGEPVRGIFMLAAGAVRLSLGKNGKSILYRIARPQCGDFRIGEVLAFVEMCRFDHSQPKRERPVKDNVDALFVVFLDLQCRDCSGHIFSFQ